MDTLDELLNEEISAMSYTDDELIVNADDRTIYIPNTLAGVTSDEKSTRLKLRCPRYVGDNIDLSTMNVYINFKNANGDIYSYLTDDVAVDGTDITFSWLLSRDVTTYKGNVNFIVCAKKIQADGKITIEWNTTLATLTVLEGLEPADSYIPTEKVDVATELMNAVNAVKAELNGVKESIKDSVPVVPTKVSELENDSNYINTIPDEYITEAELNAHTSNNDVHVTSADRSKWNGKFDSNQGTSNAGKLLGTNSSGDVVAIRGYGFEYDETTKMLKYGTDPTTNLNQGIGLDDTLNKKGYAAEASAVGELKSDLDYITEKIKPINKLNPNNYSEQTILNSTSGELSQNTSFFTENDFIPVKSGDIVYITGITSTGGFNGITAIKARRYVLYALDKSVVNSGEYGNSIVVTQDGYIRLSFANSLLNYQTVSVTINEYPTKITGVTEYFDEYRQLKVQSDINALKSEMGVLQSDVNALKSENSPSVNMHIIDCWGDSRTEMITTGGTSYSDTLQTLLGDDYIVCNMGKSGQTSGQINARLGGNSVYVSVEGNTIPASGNVPISDLRVSSGNIRNLYHPTGSNVTKIALECSLNGVKGRLVTTSATLSNNYFSRDIDGDPVTINPRTKAYIENIGENKNHISILWWGKNDFSKAGQYAVSGILANYESAVKYLGHDKFIILGETMNIKDSYLEGGADRVKVDEINNALVSLYPDNFIDINSELIRRGLSICGITATDDDNTFIANGWIPRSLMVNLTNETDTVHPNENGRYAIGVIVHDFMVSKKWVS